MSLVDDLHVEWYYQNNTQRKDSEYLQLHWTNENELRNKLHVK